MENYTIRAVIFDLDGTLSDSLADIMATGNATLRSFGFPERDIDVWTRAVGDGIANALLRCLPEEAPHDDEMKAGLAARYAELYEEYKYRAAKPYDGVASTLSALKRRGIRLAVLSNKPDYRTKEMISVFFGDEIFDEVRGDKEPFSLKPDPAQALDIAKKLGIPVGEIAFVGDSPQDILTAVNSGMIPVGALYGYRSREDLIESGAKFLIKQPADLLEIVVRQG